LETTVLSIANDILAIVQNLDSEDAVEYTKLYLRSLHTMTEQVEGIEIDCPAILAAVAETDPRIAGLTAADWGGEEEKMGRYIVKDHRGGVVMELTPEEFLDWQEEPEENRTNRNWEYVE